jgi:hypothetical protein
VEEFKEVLVRPPQLVHGRDKTLDLQMFGIWFNFMARACAGQNLTLGDGELKGMIDGVRASF